MSIGILETGAGIWNPVVWIAVLAAVAVIVCAIRAFGNRSVRTGKDASMPFFSGNELPEMHIKASNIYWGFFESLKKYYRIIIRMHTGVVNDYVYAFILVTVIMLIMFAAGGFI